tara:strand:+ start:225 stop:1433 length:1209 start_codon:yes stop_codon:yes gene_type:complete
MKNWSSLNINRKTMIENYKISIFDKKEQNVQLYTCDFICNNKSQLLLELVIELYFEYYINDISIIKNISNCIEIVKNFNKIYLTQEKLHFNILSNQLMLLHKSNNIYYKKGFECALSLDRNILLKNLVDINKKTYITITQYLPTETHNYFLELIYYISSSNINKVFDLLNTIINKFKKVKLLKNIETINETFKDDIIILLFELFKIYKNFINNPKLNNTYDICYEIFNWKLKRTNIIKRSSIIFLLFEMILTNKGFSIKNKNTKIDIDNINNIYNQLMDYYDIDKTKKETKTSKQKKKLNRNSNESKNVNNGYMIDTNEKNRDTNKNENDDENYEESVIDKKMSYLFNIIDYDKKELKHKNHKVERNKHIMNGYNVNKPIELDCNDKLFKSVKNDVNIIKNY